MTKEADYLVGSKEAGGLSIEQTKRLSIAVELAASPSIVFLDEPTSGECCQHFRMLYTIHGEKLLTTPLLLSVIHRIGCSRSFTGNECSKEDGK